MKSNQKLKNNSHQEWNSGTKNVKLSTVVIEKQKPKPPIRQMRHNIAPYFPNSLLYIS